MHQTSHFDANSPAPLGRCCVLVALLGSLTLCRPADTRAPIAAPEVVPPRACCKARAPGERVELNGRLQTPDGRPASGARVALARDNHVIGDVAVASDGGFSVSLDAGERYVLAATHPELGAVRETIDARGAIQPVLLELGSPCSSARGTLRDEGGAPFVDARVTFWGGAGAPDTPYTAHTDPEGKFALALPPGRYVVTTGAGEGMEAI